MDKCRAKWELAGKKKPNNYASEEQELSGGWKGREALLLRGTSGSAGTQRDVERGGSSPITCPWPQNLPAPPGPPCPVRRYSLHEYLGISAIGNRRGAPKHWPNRGNGSRGDKSLAPTTRNNPVSQKTTLARGFPAWKQRVKGWGGEMAAPRLSGTCWTPHAPTGFQGTSWSHARFEFPAPEIQTWAALDSPFSLATDVSVHAAPGKVTPAPANAMLRTYQIS